MESQTENNSSQFTYRNKSPGCHNAAIRFRPFVQLLNENKQFVIASPTASLLCGGQRYFAIGYVILRLAGSTVGMYGCQQRQ